MYHNNASRLAFLLTAPLLLVTALLASGAEFEPEMTESAYLDQIELRSVVSLPGERMFSLHDPVNDRRFWIQTGQTRYGIEAVAFDEETNLLTLRHAETERQLGLAGARIGRGEPEREVDERALRQSEREQRLAEREQRHEERDRWRDLRERIRDEAETSTEIAAISEAFTGYREEMRTLRAALQEADRDSPEFQALRAQVLELNESFEDFREAAGDTLAEHPAFSEEDVERMRTRGLEGGPRGGGDGGGRN